MESMEPPRSQPRVDRGLPHIKRDQLPTRHHPILPPGQLSNARI
jgi:hypothetical protein